MSMTEEQTLQNEKKIIGDYPNTYTFSKAMVERTLEKLRGHLKLAIVRPAIVVSAHDEPLNGWTETISAMGALLFAGMLGLVNYMQADPKQALDLVPVDYVSNNILCTTVYTAY